MRALALALFLPIALSAQPDSSTTLAFAEESDHADTVAAPTLIGTYTSDDATLFVARSGQNLVLTLAGQDALDAFAPVEANRTFNVRAEALLRDAFSGSTDKLAAALPEHRRERGTRDFTRLLTTITDQRGVVAFLQMLGTTQDARGLAVTFVRVQFDEGEEVLKLRWRDGRLALITRGVLPHVTAQPVRGSDHRFAVRNADGAPVTTLVFGEDGLTARGAARTFIATRTR